MTDVQFAALVARMRRWQRAYLLTGDRAMVPPCRVLERMVDTALITFPGVRGEDHSGIAPEPKPDPPEGA